MGTPVIADTGRGAVDPEPTDPASTAPDTGIGPPRRVDGTTEIRTRAIENAVRGIVRALTTHPAIEPRDVDVHRDDGAVVVDVSATVSFPTPAGDAGRIVQRAVGDALPRLTGERVDAVHVTIVPTADDRPTHVSAWPGWISTIQRVVAALVALALVAGATVVAVDLVGDLVGDEPVVGSWAAWFESARDTAWDDTSVLGVGFLLVAVGSLLVLLASLRDARSRTMAIPGSGRVAWRVRRYDLRRDLERVVVQSTGARRVRARVGSGARVRMRLDTTRTDHDQVRQQAIDAVQRRRAELMLDERADVRVELRSRR